MPNPVNFEAVTAGVGPGQVQEEFACGPGVKRHLEIAGQFAGAGFDHLARDEQGPARTGSWTSSPGAARAGRSIARHELGDLLTSRPHGR